MAQNMPQVNAEFGAAPVIEFAEDQAPALWSVGAIRLR